MHGRSRYTIAAVTDSDPRATNISPRLFRVEYAITRLMSVATSPISAAITVVISPSAKTTSSAIGSAISNSGNIRATM